MLLIIALIGVILFLTGMHQEISFIWSIACFELIIGELFYGIGSIRSKEILSDLIAISKWYSNVLRRIFTTNRIPS